MVLRHEVNQGKGRALKTAFAYVVASQSAIHDVVTCDSDGQHSLQDIAAIADRLATNRQRDRLAVVWGSRDFEQAEIPWKSRFGNKTTSRVVWLLCGRYLGDTQTGLRGYPVEMLEEVSAVKGERFEYEMNVLLMLLDRRVAIEEIPIQTIYHDSDNTQSHFRPIHDSLQVFMQIGRFTVSSLAGAVIDLLLYALIVNFAFGGRPDTAQIIVSVVLARIVSSLVNFILNRDWVFASSSSKWLAFVKYYALVVLILIGSAIGTASLAKVLHGHVVWAKILVDTVLFILSFAIQKRWVFSGDRAAATES